MIPTMFSIQPVKIFGWNPPLGVMRGSNRMDLVAFHELPADLETCDVPVARPGHVPLRR